MILWKIAHAEGQFEEAIMAASNYFRLFGEPAPAEALDGDMKDADYSKLMRQVADLLDTHSARSYVGNIEHAALRIHAGEFDRALDRLEEAYAQRETSLIYTIVDPLFRPVWNDERYQTILRNMNYD